MSRVRIEYRVDINATVVSTRDGMGRFTHILDERGVPIDLRDYDGRAGERPQFSNVTEALAHFERVLDVFARMA